MIIPLMLLFSLIFIACYMDANFEEDNIKILVYSVYLMTIFIYMGGN